MVTEYTQNGYHDYLTRTNINEITETNILNTDKEQTRAEVDLEQEQDLKESDKLKIYHVRKNQINSMAGFFYGLGCSIVHLALFVAANFVRRPQLDRAKELDRLYLQDLKEGIAKERGFARLIDKARMESVDQ